MSRLLLGALRALSITGGGAGNLSGMQLAGIALLALAAAFGLYGLHAWQRTRSSIRVQELLDEHKQHRREKSEEGGEIEI